MSPMSEKTARNLSILGLFAILGLLFAITCWKQELQKDHDDKVKNSIIELQQQRRNTP